MKALNERLKEAVEECWNIWKVEEKMNSEIDRICEAFARALKNWGHKENLSFGPI